MLIRVALFTVLLFFTTDDPRKQGRRGNDHYEQGRPQEAAEAYRAGLAGLARGQQHPAHYGLLNNLGAALYRLGHHEEAQTAFGQALNLSRTDADVARTAYNAGDNAYVRQNLEEALAFYRDALLADPDHEDAKYNYEFVKRQLEQQQQQQQQQGDQSQQQQNQSQQNPSGQDDEQEGEDQQQQQDQQQEQGDQGQQQQQQGQDEGDQQQQPQAPDPDPHQLSPEEAERILQALENDEQQLLRQVQKLKSSPRSVEKDW